MPAKGLQCERIYFDKTLNEELCSALEERDQYRESFLKAWSENQSLKNKIRLLECMSAPKKKKTTLGWF